MKNKHNYRVEANVIEKDGSWNHQLVEVFDKTKKIGEYTRNYPTGGAKTFIPFVGEDNNWYALYSPNYVFTRIMKLPSCKDIGGEEYSKYGFCPIEYYQPRVHKTKRSSETKYEFFLDDHDMKGFEKDILETKYLPIIFVAGCVWGADSSYQILAFDIRQAHKGVIKRFNPLGYFNDLPEEMSLAEAIRSDYDSNDGMMTFKIKIEQRISFEKDFDVTSDDFHG